VFTVGAQTSGTWAVDSIQLEKGSTATSFDYRPYGTELALCQRYYQKATSESAAGTMLTAVICSGTTSGNGAAQLMYPMRATPTFDSSAASTFAYSDGATATACTSLVFASGQSSSRMASINFNTAGGLTQYRMYRIEANSSATAFFGFSAEL
jgi:hypothetical protein